MAQIHFFLNSSEISIDINPNMTLLDFIRYEKGLIGTKIGCREGDCGACTVILGSKENGKVIYRNITSCLTPMGNVNKCHILTIEGINLPKELTTPQQFLVNTGGTQCGFCTVGFIVSFTAYSINYYNLDENIEDWIDGNICRCTGYKSIEKAGLQLSENLSNLKKNYQNVNLVQWLNILSEEKYLPTYVGRITKHLDDVQRTKEKHNQHNKKIVSGGTDLYVQIPDKLIDLEIDFVKTKDLSYVKLENNIIKIGGTTNSEEFVNSPIIERELPQLKKFFKLIASKPIRNIATLSGNIVNASPIADFVNILLMLDTNILTNTNRIIKLDQFYKDYKVIDLKENEYITEIQIPWNDNSKPDLVNFEKVSKRTILDIASVNSSIGLKLKNGKIESCRITAGGVAPIPMYLVKTSDSFQGKVINEDTIKNALEIMETEVNPISDIRGSDMYKKLLLRQLIISHFIELFPENQLNLRRILA